MNEQLLVFEYRGECVTLSTSNRWQNTDAANLSDLSQLMYV